LNKLDIESLTILNDKEKKKLVEKLETIIGDLDQEVVSYSSDKAEHYHHENCSFDCCGEHDFGKYSKCPKCSMTEEIQEQHNDDVWKNIDYVEGNDHVQEYRDEIFEKLNQVIVFLGGEKVFHH
jgi:hypothetical protein